MKFWRLRCSRAAKTLFRAPAIPQGIHKKYLLIYGQLCKVISSNKENETRFVFCACVFLHLFIVNLIKRSLFKFPKFASHIYCIFDHH